jgi:enediyne biosynthesis protein E4
LLTTARAAQSTSGPALWFNPPVRRPVYSAIAVGLAVGAPVSVAGEDDVPAALGAPRFVEESGAVDHRYTGDFQYFVGGGVAAFDCDDDRRSELFFAGGSGPAALYHNESVPGGALRFSARPSPVTDLSAVTGAYPLDVDGDGHTDLAVLRVGEDVVLRGLGDCRFERANETLGIEGGDTWTVAFSATWEGGNELPTLAFGDYLDADRERCEDSRLVRPEPGGDHYATPVRLSPGYCTLSMLFSDWDRSGRQDLRMTNDRHYYRDGTEQLWRVDPGVTPRPYTEADGWRPMQIWGMGIASADVTGDGYPDVYLTSQGDNKLQTLADGPAQPTYEDIALERGATAHRPFTGGDVLPSTAWHAEFADVNNDGFLDLFVAKGNVEAQPGYATRDPSNLLLGQADGTFVEGAEAAGIVSYHRARGGALVDLNLDGLLDLVVVNRVEPVTLWRNVGAGTAEEPVAMGNWSAFRLRQPAPNVDAIGAWVEARFGDRTVVDEVTVGGGHGGGQLGWLHLGLGDATDAELRVHWPDGELGPWIEVDAGEFAIIERGASAPTPWHPEERR